MSVQLSHRAKAIKSSPTLAVMALAQRMMAEGKPVINFGVGEPDFCTPTAVKEAAKQAIDENFTHYTPSEGIKELREAISQKLKRDNGLICRPQDILVSPGAKASIIHVLMAVCDPRDEVLIPSPYWVSYTSQVELVDAFPILLPTTIKSGFKITAEQLEEKINSLSNPKVLILNSPNNPTGVIYSREELEKIAEVCVKHNILILSDEIYEKLIYDGREHVSIASISDEVKNMTVLVNGVSKAYAMTGWRLGYCAGPTEVIRRAACIQGHTTSCVNSITQKAAITALLHCEDAVVEMRQQFEKRRNFIVEMLNNIPHINCIPPQGAFYVMPDISYYLKHNNRNISSSKDLCEYLVSNFHVAIVPGLAFGADEYVRFSFATSMDNIRKGMEQFREGLESLI